MFGAVVHQSLEWNYHVSHYHFHHNLLDYNPNTMAETIKEEEEKKTETISLIVTAFGPFKDVDENPTNTMLGELLPFLDAGAGSWKAQVMRRIQDLVIVETSADGAKEALEGIASDLANHPNGKVVLLHLGVDIFGSEFHVEECAYNTASFRVPDERDYQPTDVPIRSDVPLETPLQTRCNVADLVEHLSKAFPALETNVSTDPGRFVCNYLYYTSLHKLQDELPKTVEASLFLHVPPFDKVPKEIQMEYLAEVMRVLTKVELS